MLSARLDGLSLSMQFRRIPITISINGSELTVAVLALFFLDDPITLAIVVGGALILGGAVLAMLIRTTKTAEPPI